MFAKLFSPSRRSVLLAAATLSVSFAAAQSAPAAEVASTYTGANNGNWSVNANWNPNGSPINGTDQFDVSITNLAVVFDVSGSSNINSLALSGGSLTLNSGDSLAVLNSGSITASSLTVNFTVFNGDAITTLDGSNVTSNAGGAISFAGITTSTTANVNANYSWQANGSGAVLTANNLTTLNLDGSATFTLGAYGGGLLSLASLTTLNQVGTRTLAIQAFDASSTVNLVALGNNPLSNLNVEIRDGGTVSWGTPTTLTNSVVTIRGAATLDTSAITDADASQFSVNLGVSSPTTPGVLSLPALTSYTASSANVNESWSADGSGSTLSANNMTTLNLPGFATLFFSVTNGGIINLNALNAITISGSRSVDFQAFGANSTINIPALGPAGISNQNVIIEIHDGGTVNWDTGVSFTTTFAGGTLNINGAATIDTAHLTNVNTSQFSVNNGISSPSTPGILSMPALTSYTASSANVNESWSATGSGSTLSANSLTTLNLPGFATLFFSATNGGIINLNALTTITISGSRAVDFQAFGANSTINLSALGPAGIANQNVIIEIHDGGAVNWDAISAPTTFSGSTLIIDGAATINTSAISNADTSQFSVNNGIASPSTPGILSLPALTSYTASSANVNESWSANGSGSTLSANSLTTLNLPGFATLFFSANNGGVINLNALTTITNPGVRAVDFQAFGANSTVNITALGPAGISNQNVIIEIHDGGTVNWDTGVSFTTTFAGSTLSINGAATIDTAHLTNVDTSQFSVNNGVTSPATPGTLSLPGVVTYTASTANVNESWSANGSGSTLTANNLTTIHLPGFATLFATAISGGTVNLNGLTTLDHSGSRVFAIQSQNLGSNVNLDSLTSLQDGDSIQLDDHGQVTMGAFTSAFTLDFNADFINADGSLDVYVNGNFFTSIAPNNLGSFESYSFDVPDPPSGTVTFLANGDSSQINIENYSVTAASPVPEPASLSLLAAGSLALILRRRKRA